MTDDANDNVESNGQNTQQIIREGDQCLPAFANNDPTAGTDAMESNAWAWAVTSSTNFDQENQSTTLLASCDFPEFDVPQCFENGVLDTDSAPQNPDPQSLVSANFKLGIPDNVHCYRCEIQWTASNAVIHRACHLSSKDIDFRDDLDGHIIITAVTEGWNEASTNFQLDALWDCLRELDTGCFLISGPVERIVILRMLRRLFKVCAKLNFTITKSGPDSRWCSIRFLEKRNF